MNVPRLFTTVALLAVLAAGCSSSTGQVPTETAGPDQSSAPSAGPAPMADSSTSTPGPSSTTSAVDVVEPIRAIHPDEFAVVVAGCVTEQGFAASVTRNGGVEFPLVAGDQAAALEAAVDLCRALYPVDQRFTEPLSREQLEFLYRWYVGESIPCLEGQGLVGFSPPSLETFVETFDTPDGWAPYRDIEQHLMEMTATELFDLQEVCPQAPPVDELWDQ